MENKHTPGNWHTNGKGDQPLVIDQHTGMNIWRLVAVMNFLNNSNNEQKLN